MGEGMGRAWERARGEGTGRGHGTRAWDEGMREGTGRGHGRGYGARAWGEGMGESDGAHVDAVQRCDVRAKRLVRHAALPHALRLLGRRHHLRQPFDVAHAHVAGYDDPQRMAVIPARARIAIRRSVPWEAGLIEAHWAHQDPSGPIEAHQGSSGVIGPHWAHRPSLGSSALTGLIGPHWVRSIIQS